MKRIALFLILVLCLSGCSRELPGYTLNTNTEDDVVNETPHISGEVQSNREYTIYPVDQPADHIVGNYYYYANSQIVSYYDVEIQRRVVLCSQPNCTHSAEECTAFLGSAHQVKYQVVGDIAYALINDNPNGGKVQIISPNLVSGERKVLWDLTPKGENTCMENMDFSIDKTTMFISFCQYERVLEDNVYREKNKASYAYALDLTTGENELLFKSKIPYHPDFSFTGDSLVPQVCTEEFLFIYDMEDFAEMPISEEEYYKKNPAGDYWDYVGDFWPDGAYYSVNRETGVRTRICEAAATFQDLYGPVRDRKLSFTDGDTVYIYDGRTGQITQCFTQENMGMQIYKDGRIIYNVGKTDGGYDYFWYDLTTGDTQQFQSGIDLMTFSISEETADYFIGYYKGSNRYIPKQDWYNENYDAAF